MHPHRVRFEVFSDRNLWMRMIAGLADSVRANRKPVAPDNPLLAFQTAISDQIVSALDRYGAARDQATEAFFLNVYGSPVVQAAAGLRSDLATARLRIGGDVAREAAEARSLADVEATIEQGGLVEATIRALLYVGGDGPHQVIDERVFAMLRLLRQHQTESRQFSLSRFKEIVRRQFLLLRHDEERAVAAIPALLPDAPAERQATLDAIRKVADAAGDLPEPARHRLARIEALFGDGTAVRPLPLPASGGTVAEPEPRIAAKPARQLRQAAAD
jgi:hypothetical protein